MTIEEFVARNKLIGERLDWIAKRTANMAFLGIANQGNPEFIELLQLQEKLLDASERLIEKFKAVGSP